MRAEGIINKPFTGVLLTFTAIALISCMTNWTNPSVARMKPDIMSSEHSGQEAKSDIAFYVEKRLEEKHKVIVLIIANEDNVVYNCPDRDPTRETEWKKMVVRNMESNYTASFLRGTKHPNAGVVDRSELDRIIREQELQLSELVDTKTLVRIGALTGANYIITLSFTRNCGVPGVYTDSELRKLIEVENGLVRATDRWDRTSQWDNSSSRYNLIEQ